MTQLEFYKSFQFMIELLVAESLFTFRLQRRPFFVIRGILGLAACFLFSWLFPILSNNAFFISLMFFVLFAFTVFVSKFVYKSPWLNIVFCCVAGYTTQHVSYEMYNLILNALNVNANTPMGFYGDRFVAMFSNPLITMIYFYVFIVFYFFAYYFLGRKIEKHEKLQLKNAYIFVFVILILIVDILLNAVVVFYIASGANKLYMIIVGIYNILCCLFALYLQFEVSLRRKLESTIDTLKHLWHQEKEQYAFSKENIELINLKCHDLKHQIRQIGNNGMLNQSVVSEIENLITIYDSKVKTGNFALDIILTEKSLLCNKNGIKLSCIVDGKKLNFMKEEDIYSLFGNIVDNAIEAVISLDNDQRLIDLHVKAVDTLLSINAHNFYKNSLEFKDGLPKTTKADEEYHGFGMKGIQFICNKYNGDLSINTKNQVFNINILFPLDD